MPRLSSRRATPLGVLDRDRAHQTRLTAVAALGDLLGHRVELGVDASVDQVVRSSRTIGMFVGMTMHRQVVDLPELGVLGHRRTGHARELLVHAEVVLQRDRRERLVLLADMLLLLGLDGLVQALRVAAADHETAGELVDDDDLAVLDHVLDVALEQELRLQRLLQVVDHAARRVAVDVLDAEQLLDLADALFGRSDGALGLVELEVVLRP